MTDPATITGGPSEAARENARRKIAATHIGRATPRPAAILASAAMDAAHDPALGLDRSVRLGDVVEAVRAHRLGWGADPWADFITREFGAST